MKTKAALLWSQPGKWEVTEVDLDGPKDHEVLIKMVAAGLCHSDDHIVTGDLPTMHLPVCGGHEGAGIVVEVGPAVRSLEAGDHVVLSFIPGCGRCRWCASGMQNLCDTGAGVLTGMQLDGTFRMRKDTTNVGQMAMVSTFSEYTVANEWSCVKIADEIPLPEACLVGCGVPTGWGSAVVAAGVKPGDVTIVMGVGGIGVNAVQGAAHAGASRIIAVDPVPFKGGVARTLGATDVCESIMDAGNLAQSITGGHGADNAIVSTGILTGEHVAQAFAAIRKGGTVAVTGMSKAHEVGVPISLVELAMFQKRIQGVLYGCLCPSRDMPRLLSMYQAGQLKLTELITRTYTLDEINDGYADMHAGRNIRGVITFN